MITAERVDSPRAIAPPIIEVTGLEKAYGGYQAVRGIDLEVRPGEVVAFLGPNGAGKTTTVEILEGFRPADQGIVRVLGLDPAEQRATLHRRVGIVLQEAGFPPELTVSELVDAWRGLYAHPLDRDDVIERVGLTARRDVKAKNLSGGEARRLDLALGITGRPEILFLDEPTTGFDPSARRVAWDMLDSLVDEGTTVFLTTHYLDEAERLANRVIVIASGRIVAQGTPEQLRGRTDSIIGFELPDGATAGDLPNLPRTAVTTAGSHVVVKAADPTVALAHLTSWAVARGSRLEGLTVGRPSLEDTYLSILVQNNGKTAQQ
jgi:ABC-2 type transport system ATP-binding protein